ncbi:MULTISPECIES: polysaccharide pyruvyl transferase family protein [unclassified Leeuwenhoekiella]|uniref:polysaccharide pyruvyl transferase family protein n=1 Tax=unclassified Leeuwenhoekiella TaxID=2615029 RepID=UPI000C571F92|nr:MULTISPECIES: polysaccharide pyruvyl transferase family protein [unclassified Leeuwenhoekiella]MAW96650.1 hypothetical protein [Leeuwenhoekiella sp.]MBA81539.1 hypothetical protein [Leeuwenhoekiella sp.]
MNVLIFNDTRVEKNPGCISTVNALIDFLSLTSNDNLKTYPVGTNYREFFQLELSGRRKNIFKRVASRLKKEERFDKEFNHKKWKNNYKEAIISSIKRDILAADLVVINMEGTIHHNSIGAITLLSLAKFSADSNKPVILVNGTVQNVSKTLLKETLLYATLVSVRETRTFNYLNNILPELKTHLIPDFAFKADLFQDINYTIENENRTCLYFPGVLAAHPVNNPKLTREQIVLNLNEISKLGYKVYLGIVEDAELSLGSYVNTKGFDTINFITEVPNSSIATFLKKFDLVITGRYHMGIFALRSQVKTLFLKSNSYKIEGLLEMLEKENNLYPELILESQLLETKILNLESPFELRKELVVSYDFFKEKVEKVFSAFS